MNLLSVNSDAKTTKGLALGFLTGILFLAPYKTSGTNVCSHASPACSNDCLYYAGRGRFNSVQQARLKKTELFHEDKQEFKKQLEVSIDKLIAQAKRKGLTPCVRLNGTSDIKWEEVYPSLFTDFSQLQFYDYTKIHQRMFKWLRGELPENYHLTFSRHELNEDKALTVLANGGNCAVVFRKELPKTWNRYKVHNGDEHDLRFLDKYKVCGLKAKGRAKKDNLGFVV